MSAHASPTPECQGEVGAHTPLPWRFGRTALARVGGKGSGLAVYHSHSKSCGCEFNGKPMTAGITPLFVATEFRLKHDPAGAVADLEFAATAVTERPELLARLSRQESALAALRAQANAAQGLAEAARRVVAAADVKLVPAHDDLPDYYTPSGALVDGALIHALTAALAAYRAATGAGEVAGNG